MSHARALGVGNPRDLVGKSVTAQKAIQARLARTQRLESLATLAVGVAHRFNNINTAVKGYLGMLRVSSWR